MITRAFTVLGVGDPVEERARRTLAALDALTDEGEPVLSAYRAVQDGPWLVDVLFTTGDDAAHARWLDTARAIVPDLPSFTIDPLGERDWVAESQKALHPVRAGRFIVHGSHDAARLAPSRWRIVIDAGRAFGTAHHASTKGSLLALDRIARCTPLGTVHDVGTGTGVLAIAADRLGATRVTAGDIDPLAVEVARHNVRANAARRPIGLSVADGPFARADVIVANILARPLIAMASRLATATRRRIVLSGLRTVDRRRVEAAYRARGLVVESRIVIDDWVTITMRRPSLEVVAPRGRRRSAAPAARGRRGAALTERGGRAGRAPRAWRGRDRAPSG